MIRWGIIGCGRIAHRFMQGLNDIEDAALVSVWSRRPETVKSFVDRYGGSACSTIDELLLSNVDAVYIATLPDSHVKYSIMALNAGKHVLCEKPAAINLVGLKKVLAVAKSKQLLFMEGMKPPFFPLYRRLKEYLSDNPIGPVGYVRAGSSVNDLTPDHPNFNYQLIGGSLMQIGIYEAFLAIDWLGPADKVQALGRFGDTGIDLFSIFQSQHGNGFAQLYCGLDHHGCGDALIVAPKGYVTIHKNWWNPSRATINYLDGHVVELDEPFAAGGLNYEIEHFCGLIKTNQVESPVISHEMSCQMIRMLDNARKIIELKYKGE